MFPESYLKIFMLAAMAYAAVSMVMAASMVSLTKNLAVCLDTAKTNKSMYMSEEALASDYMKRINAVPKSMSGKFARCMLQRARQMEERVNACPPRKTKQK